MSTKYGLRIGNESVEYSSKADRDKAMLVFTQGSSYSVNEGAGIRYKPSKGTFSTYEREQNEVLCNCNKCGGTFSQETCTQRTVQDTDWNGKYKEGTTERYLCDGCYAKAVTEYDVYKAKMVVENAGK